ncbi:nuclear receptor coactivator 6 isoform X10 [Aquila chrysaetos chrysaetos]|uniref:nuclear receptor coactivator 6 isoform X10 n=1 Tax=Aquila chrysaetos chrysaetos TaxID=223781 RepID=UPI0005D0C826|nr:nuclear receptor coactivator 6 isoform X10 [Aquila chrysaetos chrysaetos]
MLLDDLPNLKDTYASLYSSAMEDLEVDFDSGLEEDELKQEAAPEDSTIFVAFKGNIGDRDFEQKLDTILENVPGLLHMESNKLKLQKIEPWNSVRVTFNIPREAAERLRILAQNNNQQLRDLGILSVQIEGEGAINLALAQNRSQDVRINGPLGASNSVRMETGFPMQGGQGLIRMSNAAAVMMSQSGNVPSSMVASGASAELQPRTPRPSSQPEHCLFCLLEKLEHWSVNFYAECNGPTLIWAKYPAAKSSIWIFSSPAPFNAVSSCKQADELSQLSAATAADAVADTSSPATSAATAGYSTFIYFTSTGSSSPWLEPASFWSTSASSSPGSIGYIDSKPGLEKGPIAWTNAAATSSKTISSNSTNSYSSSTSISFWKPASFPGSLKLSPNEQSWPVYCSSNEKPSGRALTGSYATTTTPPDQQVSCFLSLLLPAGISCIISNS